MIKFTVTLVIVMDGSNVTVDNGNAQNMGRTKKRKLPVGMNGHMQSQLGKDRKK